MKRICFLDTNVLLYAAGAQVDEPAKHQIAARIVHDDILCVSTQVIGEFYHNVRRKFSKAIPVNEANAWIDKLSLLPSVDVDMSLIRSGMFIAERYKIAFWDASLIAASERLQASVLYTEDLNHGQKYGAVTVINPFRDR